MVTYLVAAPVDSVLRGVPWQTSVLMLSWSAPASVGSGLSDLNHEVLEALGLFDDLEFVPVDDFYEIRGPACSANRSRFLTASTQSWQC